MTVTASVGTQQNHIGLQINQDDGNDKQDRREETCKSEGTQAGGTLQHQKSSQKTSISTGTGTRSKDYNENIMHEHQITSSKRNKSKSTEDMNVDSGTLKKMLKPMHGNESPVTSPEMGRRRYNYYNAATNTAPHGHQHIIHNSHMLNNNSMSRQPSQSSRFSGSRQALWTCCVSRQTNKLMFAALRTKSVAVISHAGCIWNWRKNVADWKVHRHPITSCLIINATPQLRGKSLRGWWSVWDLDLGLIDWRLRLYGSFKLSTVFCYLGDDLLKWKSCVEILN